MVLDFQVLFNAAAGLIFLGAGWFLRQLWDAVERLKQDLHELERELPVMYVRRDEYTEIMRDIKEMFNKINDKLDNKADK
jgi:cobalamin biosynthesis Co2+ chelatase CbiK